MKRLCANCMFYDEERPPLPDAKAAKMQRGGGKCRLHAPVAGAGWPQVSDHDWCGDHVPLPPNEHGAG